LHKALFAHLRKIETDGTFDQEAPLNRLIAVYGSSDHLYHSFDLSAATDRLPMQLQIDILNLLQKGLGDL